MTSFTTTDTPLSAVLEPGLAERITEAFGHQSVGDLLHTLPRRYRQHGQRYDKRELAAGERVTIVGTVASAQTPECRTKKGRRGEILTLTAEDGGTPFQEVYYDARGPTCLRADGTVA